MSDCDLEGRIFLSVPHIHAISFFLHTFHFWKWVFYNAVISIADVCQIVMTIPIITVTFSYIIMFSAINLNNGIPWRPIQPVYIKCTKILDFYLSHGMDKGVWDKICINPYPVCKICVICGNSYPVYKKNTILHFKIFFSRKKETDKLKGRLTWTGKPYFERKNPPKKPQRAIIWEMYLWTLASIEDSNHSACLCSLISAVHLK